MHQVEVATTQETLLDNPEMVLNMGPQHPSTHGVLRIILRLDGETVIDLDCDIGFLHRGMEKIAENRLYPMIAPYWDRLDYIAAVSNGLVWVETVEQMLGLEVPPRAHYIRTILTELNRIWLGRTVGIGVISAEDAIAIGLSGPALRGSGVAWDIRKSRPYAAYADMDFEIPVGENGDTYDRYLVRLEEMRQSRRIVQQALKQLPDGPVNAKIPKVIKPPVGDYYHSIEGPKGEIGCYLVSDGTSRPYRVRVRPPCLINLQALRQMCIGHLVADVVAIIGTLDIVLGEIDR